MRSPRDVPRLSGKAGLHGLTDYILGSLEGGLDKRNSHTHREPEKIFHKASPSELLAS